MKKERGKFCEECEFFFYWMASYRYAILGQKRRAGDLTCDSFVLTEAKEKSAN